MLSHRAANCLVQQRSPVFHCNDRTWFRSPRLGTTELSDKMPKRTKGTCSRLRPDPGRPSLKPLSLILTDRATRRSRKRPQQPAQPGCLQSCLCKRIPPRELCRTPDPCLLEPKHLVPFLAKLLCQLKSASGHTHTSFFSWVQRRDIRCTQFQPDDLSIAFSPVLFVCTSWAPTFLSRTRLQCKIEYRSSTCGFLATLRCTHCRTLSTRTSSLSCLDGPIPPERPRTRCLVLLYGCERGRSQHATTVIPLTMHHARGWPWQCWH